jgi:hypothetical protein
MIHMANAKTYPLHRDAYGLAVDQFVSQALYDEAMDKEITSVMESMDGVKPFQKFPVFYRRRNPNFNDPMALFYVLDGLVSTQRGSYIRPIYISNWLQTRAPMYNWELGLTGRMIAGIYETVIETYLDEEDEGGMPYIARQYGDGKDIPHDERLHWLPFAKGRDSRGKYYVLDPQNGDEGVLWMLKFRWLVGKLATAAMQVEQTGHLGAGWGKAQTPVNFYLQICPDPIRSAQAYRNQQHPGQPFPLVRQERVDFQSGVVHDEKE